MARQTNKELIAELRRIANFETFGGGGWIEVKSKNIFSRELHGFSGDVSDLVRDQTRIYRDSWLAPLLDEVEKRLVK